MSTFLALAGNSTDDEELLCARDSRPMVTCRVPVNRRVRKDDGKRVEDEPASRNLMYGTAAVNLHDSTGHGGRISLGREKTGAWIDKGTGEKRTKNVIQVSNRSPRSVSPGATRPSARRSGTAATPRPAEAGA